LGARWIAEQERANLGAHARGVEANALALEEASAQKDMQICELRNVLAKTEKGNDQLGCRVKQLEHDLHQAEQDLHQAEQDLHQAEQDLHQAEQDLHQAEQDLHQAEQDLHQAAQENSRLIDTARRADEEIVRRLATLKRSDFKGRLPRQLTGWRWLPPGRRKKQRRLVKDYRLIDESPLFDPEWYLAKNPDVALKAEDPVLHYLFYGDREGRSPGPNFYARGYLEANPDVAALGANPLVHYLLQGRNENRRLAPAKDRGAPATPRSVPESQAASIAAETPPRDTSNSEGGSCELATLTRSSYDGRLPRQISGLRALSPFRRKRIRRLSKEYRLIAGSPLFDSAWYLANNPDVAQAKEDPVLHYLLHGGVEGRSPGPHFDAGLYLERNPDVKQAGINPLIHFILSGHAENRPWSSGDKSRAYRNDAALGTAIPIEYRRSLTQAGVFDEQFYKTVNSDVANAGLDCFQHFMTNGWQEGRDPSPFFKTSFYKLANPDLPKNLNPALHYIANGGIGSGRRTHPELFDAMPISFNPRSTFNPTKIPVSTLSPNFHDEPIPRIAVHAHCYYEEIIPQLSRAIKRIPFVDTLFVTTSHDDPRFAELVNNAFNDSNVSRLAHHRVPNRGRDIAPMVVQLAHDLQEFDLVLHVHTKKSVEDDYGAEWLCDVLDKLLFNKTYINTILRLFQRDDSLGIVAPSPFWQIERLMVWGANKENMTRLLKRLDLPTTFVKGDLPPFPASSMCWFRPAALAPLLNAGLNWGDFESEPIGDDGSIAHSVERALCHIGELQGYRSLFVEPLSYEYCWPARVPCIVSVIIPTYNAVEWLPSAVHSVLSQSSVATPYEIIIVDNNSIDETCAVASNFRDLYDNVTVLNEPVQGAGAARNAGIRAARGKYITFLDSDDLLAGDALQILCDAATLTKVEVVTSSVVEFDEKEFKPSIPFNYHEQVKVADKNMYADQRVLWQTITHDFGAYAKLYDRQWLVAEKIRFPQRGNFEDNAFIVDVYMRAARIAVVSRPTYFYRKYNSRSGLTQATSLSVDSLKDQINVLTEANGKYRLRKGGSLERALYESFVGKLRREVERFGFENHPGDAGVALRFAAWLRSMGIEAETNELLLDLYR
jgi:glycosyltransferase involved in cell wall biosynthesis